MGERITIDPITRIEGHLKIEVELAGGKVVDAWSSGQMFRGIEMILKGRDPRDATHFVQRSCGVCTYTHGLSSVIAVEDAVKIDIPDNARILRNLLHGAQFQHDHIVHFYHLHALDWVDVLNALKADPAKTAKLADQTSNANTGGTKYFKRVQERIKTFVDSGQLGVLNNAYWGHPAYRLPPEANLMATAHYLEALRLQAQTVKMHAIFGGKNPHLQCLVVGGVTSVRDLSAARINEFKYIWKETQNFIKNVYIPDLIAVASFYKDWGDIGGYENFLSWGEFPEDGKGSASLYMPRGAVFDKKIGDPKIPEQEQVTEDVTRAWYEDGAAQHPFKGETKPQHGDYRPSKKYSWFKAPRYNGVPCEVGPLARTLVAYAKGHPDIKHTVNHVLNELKIPVEALFSTLGRTAARGIETLVIGARMEKWIDELVENVRNGNKKTYQPWKMPDKGFGFGLNDVPRGSLGHWIEIENKKIKNYQYVVPSTWNFGPRDEKDQRGPVEQALIGTPIVDPKRPIEVLRTVHSFDPCVACGVHVIDPDSNQVYKVQAT